MKKEILFLVPSLFVLTICGCEKKQSPKTKSFSGAESKDQAHQIPSPSNSSKSSPDSLKLPPSIETESFAQAIKPITDEFDQLIGTPKKISKKQWNLIKQRYWRPGFDEYMPQNSNESSIHEMLATSEGENSLIAQIALGPFGDFIDKSEQESIRAFYLLAMLISAGGGDSMPLVFEERRDDAKITRGDIFLFEVFNDAFTEVRRHEVSESDLAQWTSMANSPNRIQRLLALRTFHSVGQTPKDWLDFYNNYSAESDLGILAEVISKTYMTMHPEAIDLLLDISKRADVIENKVLKIKIDDCVQDLSLRKQSE